MRWTNLWFPVTKGSVRGDFFGRPLRPLFGSGISDIPVEGNRPDREVRWGRAHTRYFKYPSATGDHDIVTYIRKALNLGETTELAGLASRRSDPQTSMALPPQEAYE